ncbi:hypothetical protein CCR79_02095 [Halorhodospira halophila]|nr:hypothetical protein [Halorhodospira halophila]
MKNRDIYLTDPAERKLANEGVANVNDATTSEALSVLRYELETFVCDGQYREGMAHILDTFLKNIDKAEQPAVWVSGFFGSGKSHLVKVLRTLWVDQSFPDGAAARGVTNLPQGVADLFTELNNEGKRHGGLFAASGTLGASSRDKSVRLALLAVIFRAAGLPPQYPQARFVMWLKSEGIYEEVRRRIEGAGLDWQEELDNLYVSEDLHETLVQVKPNIFPQAESCAEVLLHLYPNVDDVSSDEMVKSIRQALAGDGKFPLTLIVLDEIQQYIGGDTERSIEVQEAVEACSKQFGGKLMFVGTGQTAITGTSNLKKLEGRFTVRIELSDTDVDAVIRQVILAKRPEAQEAIQQTLETNLGEISRHLAGTEFEHRQSDKEVFTADYPILPVRRRFWERALRVLDQTGTESQLRNQLSMVHKAIQTNLDEPLGTVVAGDYLYFDTADRLLQARILPRNVHDQTLSWYYGSEDEQLKARACALVFLINKVASEGQETNLRADVDTVADLMVEELGEGSGSLRAKLPALMDDCELLLRVGDEYRIQTEESQAWQDEFLRQRGDLNSQAHRIHAERDDRLRRRFQEAVGRSSLNQGEAKVPRVLHPIFESDLPKDSQEKVCIWVRSGWVTDENSVLADARQAGSQSPTVFVFIPKRSVDDLHNQLIDYKAAQATLDKRGTPEGPAGTEAKAAMETTRNQAETRISELLDEALSGGRVFQGGGNEVLGNNLAAAVEEAARNALQRLYPKFHLADHKGWDKVYDKARKGVPDALQAVGYEGEVAKNPVCKEVVAYIAAGKKGAEIRAHFEAPPYGWPRDAVHGALQALLVSGDIRAEDENGRAVEPAELNSQAIGKTRFKVEATTISTSQRLQIRQVFQKLGMSVAQGAEGSVAGEFIQRLNNLADRAGGEPPSPERPDTAFLEEIRLSAGNEQLLAIYNRRDEIKQAIEDWRQRGEAIEERLPRWQTLEKLAQPASELPDGEALLSQVQAIRDHRRLLTDPDPVEPLIDRFSQALRERLNQLAEQFTQRHQAGMERLEQDESWQQLQPEQRNQLLAQQRLTNADWPAIQVGSTDEILETLRRQPLDALSERVAALPARFEEVAQEAAELLQPEVQEVATPRRTLQSEAEVDQWLQEVRSRLVEALARGPIRPR